MCERKERGGRLNHVWGSTEEERGREPGDM